MSKMARRTKKSSRSRAKNIRKHPPSSPQQSKGKIVPKRDLSYSKKIAAIAGTLLGIVGLGTLIAIYNATPNVHIDYFDEHDPFRFPFIIENDSSFTFTDITSAMTFFIPDPMAPRLNNGEHGDGKMWGLLFDQYGNSLPNLRPGHREDMYSVGSGAFPLAEATPQYKELYAIVKLSYRTWLIPSHLINGFKMIIATDGSRHWVEDDDVPNIIERENDAIAREAIRENHEHGR